MVSFGAGNARGILHRLGPEGRFHHARHLPTAPLDAFVQHFWIVRWDLRGESPQLQETLPHPNVYLVFENGSGSINGVATGRFSRLLQDRGFAFGVKFRPGGFYPFLREPVSALTDRRLSLPQVFGAASGSLSEEIFACDDELAMIDVIHRFLCARLPVTDANVDRIASIVGDVADDRSVTRVDDLVARYGMGKRALQRLFSRYVGVSPKWIINRYRLHEAVEQLADGQRVDWATLALDLGYFDQAHFIRDFRRLVGRTPADYAHTMRVRRD
jgi:AraC-like DNA-binding protein